MGHEHHDGMVCSKFPDPNARGKKNVPKTNHGPGETGNGHEQAGRIPSGVQTRTKYLFLVWNGYLLVLWSGMFLYGAIETIQGKIPLVRAIPAGAFLLFFIALFGWAFYQSKRRKTGLRANRK